MIEVIKTGIVRSKAPVNGTVRAGKRIFTTHGPKDPQTGDIVEGDMTIQARRVFENLKIALEAAGSSIGSLAMVTVFMADAAEFEAMNAVYREYVSEPYPTRATVVVKQLISPKARIEIQAQAWLG